MYRLPVFHTNFEIADVLNLTRDPGETSSVAAISPGPLSALCCVSCFLIYGAARVVPSLGQWAWAVGCRGSWAERGVCLILHPG